MAYLNLISNELENAGFKTEVIGNSIKISLSNRKVNTIETRIALNQIFEKISFKLHTSSNGVLVTVENDSWIMKDRKELDARNRLDKAQRLYSIAYDPRMFCSDYYGKKSAKNGVDEAASIVSLEFGINTLDAEKLLYLAHSSSEFVGFTYQKQLGEE